MGSTHFSLHHDVHDVRAGHGEPRLHPGRLLGPLPRHHLALGHPVRGAHHQEEDLGPAQVQDKCVEADNEDV